MAQPGGPGTQFDFVALHNVTKYIAYLTEAANAMLLVVDDLQMQSRSLLRDMDDGLVEQVVASLAYQKGLFRSENLRLKSLDKRMQNIINLVRSTPLPTTSPDQIPRHSIW
jgi:hypothetical protein